ncbi:MAG: glycosyltransferase family 2 protein [Candidatus Sericytochromatia bacterium]|nr:glycosyltransferase family 2 protein [Candidatus Tanganyikabacteria bacterium]
MLNVVVPMAGRGSRFADAGYDLPKPLIPVHGVPMTELVIGNIRPPRPHRFIFLCLREHLDRYGLAAHLRRWAPGCEVVPVDRVTAGAACTVLLAEDLIDSADGLMIANCDQWVDVSIDAYLAVIGAADGLIMTMWADDPKWSFVRLGPAGRPCEVVEKRVVSNEATVGIYNFRHGRDFVAGAKRMIARDLRVNGEFYVAPVYNELLAGGANLAIHNIGRDRAGMYGLGTPADLEWFLAADISRKAVARALAA